MARLNEQNVEPGSGQNEDTFDYSLGTSSAFPSSFLRGSHLNVPTDHVHPRYSELNHVHPPHPGTLTESGQEMAFKMAALALFLSVVSFSYIILHVAEVMP